MLCQSKNQANIAILGTGAIGQLLFHQLSQANIRVLMLRKANNEIRPNELNFSSINPINSDSYLTQKVKFATSNNAISNFEHIELVIVCVKAYQVINALTPFMPLLPKNCHVLLLHNGIGSHSKITEILGQRGLSLGTTSQGALRISDWHVRQTGTGKTQIGHFAGSKLSSTLKQQLIKAIPNLVWQQNIMFSLWTKLAINAAINPLTARYQCKNGELEEQKFKPLIKNVTTELILVANAENIDLTLGETLNQIYEVISLTFDNYSSMHQDIMNGRKTEIDAINGYIVTQGKKHHIAVPTNEKLLYQIKALSG